MGAHVCCPLSDLNLLSSRAAIAVIVVRVSHHGPSYLRVFPCHSSLDRPQRVNFLLNEMAHTFWCRCTMVFQYSARPLTLLQCLSEPQNGRMI